MRTVSVISAFFLTACVTINIYFPAAAAEKVADEIIRGIQAEKSISADDEEIQPQTKIKGGQQIVYQLIDATIEFIIPSVQAANVDMSVNTAEIRKLRAKMKARFSALKPFYAKGTIGIKADGFIVMKGKASLKNRNRVKKLIMAENADRQRLYQAIANANGHPDWFAQIKSTFATRWVRHAQSGWWYKPSNGSWKQK